MRSLHSILKRSQQNDVVQTYEYSTDFNDEFEEISKRNLQRHGKGANRHIADGMSLDAYDEEDGEAWADKIIKEAHQKAEKIMAKAEEEAALLKEETYAQAKEEGYTDGYAIGRKEAYDENTENLERQGREFLQELSDVIKMAAIKKDETLKNYRNDLKNISLAIAEKVIQISLKSSGEVIEKMIISATEKLKTKQWAKIYVAKCDFDLMVEGDIDILNALVHLSDHVKIVSMENESPGTCIIELPDEIIDASANTQVENIKEILNSAGI